MQNLYYGIADCHGLESFIKEDSDMSKNMNIMKVRADANEQRHAILYVTKLDTKNADFIEGLINKGKYKEALTYLKEVTKDIKVSGGEDAKKSLDVIPNPELDPLN